MEQIRHWAFAICVAAVVASSIRLMTPEGKVNKAFQCMIGLFFLTCAIGPFLSLRGEDFSSKLPESQALTEITTQVLSRKNDEQILQLTVNGIESELRALLSSRQIDPENIRVKGYFTEDNSIAISSVEITLPQPDAENMETIRQTVLDAVMIEPSILIKEDAK